MIQRRTPLKRKTPLKRTSMKQTSNSFGALEKVDWSGVMRIARSPLKRKPTRRLPGVDDPEYRDWLKQWPCYVCFLETYKMRCGSRVFKEDVKDPEIRRGFRDIMVYSDSPCAVVDVAHIGVRGRGQRCKDREAIPLGAWHHRNKTAPGGGPESHHTLGKKFWAFHGLDKTEVIATLNRLYHQETGRWAT